MKKSDGSRQAGLRLVVIDGELVSNGYKSGRRRWRETPDTASKAITRSAGTRPERAHFWTACHVTPIFLPTDRKPPPDWIAVDTGPMTPTLQPRVAIRQQPRVAACFSSIQHMVANAEKERERFRDALNARVKKDHPEKRGRPQWLRDKLHAHMKRTGNRSKPVSAQTCAYWLSGQKIAKPHHVSMLCDALGMTRGELFGESEDPRLAALIERWADLPEHMKNGIASMITPTEPAEEHHKVRRAS